MIPDALLYDDRCPMCTAQVRLLSRLDGLGAVRPVPMSSAEARAIAPQITSAELHEQIHCVTPKGRIYRGARALRRVGLRVPLLAPLAMALWLPGTMWLAERAYRWVARNRYVLSRVFGCTETCAVQGPASGGRQAPVPEPHSPRSPSHIP